MVGDGAFGLSAMEVETAVRAGAGALWVVADNNGWNIERFDQLERYGRVVAVDLGGHYDALTLALGAQGERVQRAEELDSALARPREPSGRGLGASQPGAGLTGRPLRPGLGSRPAGAGLMGRGGALALRLLRQPVEQLASGRGARSAGRGAAGQPRAGSLWNDVEENDCFKRTTLLVAANERPV